MKSSHVCLNQMSASIPLFNNTANETHYFLIIMMQSSTQVML